MKKINKKAFTIVELVIVIAVIAILAALLIPTFSSIIKKAYYSTDVQTCKNMNTSLFSEYPIEKPVYVEVVKNSLVTNHFSEKNFTTKSTGYHFYWCKEDNRIYFVKDQEIGEFIVEYPVTGVVCTKDNSHRLDKDYWKVICAIEGATLNVYNIDKDSSSAIIKVIHNNSKGILIDVNGEKLSGDHETNVNYVISDINSNIEITLDTTDPDCLAKGTKITLADGTLKNIEDIVKGDVVLTYNHEKGIFEGQAVYLAWAAEEKKAPFTLHFEEGVSLSIIGDHVLFEEESLNYVTILESTANEFIGKHFYSVEYGKYLELLSVTYGEESVEYYEIYTEYNVNCVAEGMLNAPLDSIEVLLIYTYYEDLTIDHVALTNDIEEYGLYAYDSDCGFEEHVYDMSNWKYINIIIGKGLGTYEEFEARKADFAQYK